LISPSSRPNLEATPDKPATYPNIRQSSLKSTSDQREIAKDFIRVLSQHNYGFATLVNEGLDPIILSQLYEELGLEKGLPASKDELDISRSSVATQGASGFHSTLPGLSSQPDLSIHDLSQNGSRNRALTSQPEPATAPATNSDQKSSTTQSSTKLAQSEDKNADPGSKRQEYIARLMAARGKKAATSDANPAATNPLSSQPKPPESVAPDSNALPTQPPAKDETNFDDSAESETLALKRKAQTELARKRIEALQSMRNKALQQSKSEAGGSNLPGVAPAVQPTGSTSALPGLYAPDAADVSTGTSDQEISNTGMGVSLSVSGEKRSRNDSSDSDGQSMYRPTPTKRQFGEPRHSPVHHEKFVIDISDDESTDSIMDLDDSQSDRTRSALGPRGMGPSIGSSQSLASKKASIARSIPSGQPSTPSGGSFLDIEDRIAALKQEIAEKEKRKLARQKDSRAQTPATVQTSTATTPKPETQQERLRSRLDLGTSSPHSLPTKPTAATAVSQVSPTVRRNGTSSSSPAGDVGFRQRRRAEIQSGMPTIDATVASNNARLEQLRREMELLEAENQKKLAEKEKLITELEELGVDTEGIPDEDLQAKRDEVVQQLQDEERLAPETLSQTTPAPASAASSVLPPINTESALTGTQPAPFASNDTSASASQLARDDHGDPQISPTSALDDAMDMSDSESDEGEILSGNTGVSTEQSSTMRPEEPAVITTRSVDASNDTIPANQVNLDVAPASQTEADPPAIDNPGSDDEMDESSSDFYGNDEPVSAPEVTDVGKHPISTDNGQEQEDSDMNEASEDYPPSVDMEKEGADPTDEEDYEPPDPAADESYEPPAQAEEEDYEPPEPSEMMVDAPAAEAATVEGSDALQSQQLPPSGTVDSDTSSSSEGSGSDSPSSESAADNALSTEVDPVPHEPVTASASLKAVCENLP
jgi:hypothetical protein